MARKRAERREGEGERGQAIVEFALVLPLFLVLLFALVDFGRGYQAWLQVTNAAREGARVGAVRGSASEIESRVRAAAGSLDQGRLSVSTSNAQGAPGGSVVVRVSYAFSFITPLSGSLNLLSGGTISTSATLSSTADMRLE